MSDIHCAEDSCTECERIVLRVYCELRRAGYAERQAFDSAMHVLELRHPGHSYDYYRARTSGMISPAAMA